MGLSDSEDAFFKKKLKELGYFKGSNTELISVYIPNGTDRSGVMTQLTNEVSQSSNIKDQRTRKNVQGALKRIMNFLKQIDFKIPDNGLCVFSGNISREKGKVDLQLFTIKPTKRLAVKMYWCDSEFHLAPLQEMVESGKLQAVIVLDKRDATLALIRGKSYEIIGHFTSNVPGKIRAGGQSSQRFMRLREEAEHDFYKRVSEKANAALVPLLDKINGVVIAGPGMTKNAFIETELLDYRVKEKVLGTIDTGYADEHGIKEALDKSNELLKDSEIIKEKVLVQRFFAEVGKNELATFGLKNVKEALTYGKAQELLLSEGIETRVFGYKCNSCKKEFEEHTESIYKKPTGLCPECKKNSELLKETELTEDLIEIAERTNAKIHFISVETDEGKQFLEAFAGIGAILRFK